MKVSELLLTQQCEEQNEHYLYTYTDGAKSQVWLGGADESLKYVLLCFETQNIVAKELYDFYFYFHFNKRSIEWIVELFVLYYAKMLGMV